MSEGTPRSHRSGNPTASRIDPWAVTLSSARDWVPPFSMTHHIGGSNRVFCPEGEQGTEGRSETCHGPVRASLSLVTRDLLDAWATDRHHTCQAFDKPVWSTGDGAVGVK